MYQVLLTKEQIKLLLIRNEAAIYDAQKDAISLPEYEDPSSKLQLIMELSQINRALEQALFEGK